MAWRLEELRTAWGLSDESAGLIVGLLSLIAGDPAAPTSVSAPPEAIDAHIADSLTALSVENVAGARAIADIGSGAGFPGLVLAAVLQGAAVDMLESVRRKCVFIENAVSTLELSNARAVCARAEQWGAGDGANAYQVATARAVGRLATVLEYAAPLLEVDGIVIAWKGRRDHVEEDEAERAAAVLGLGLTSVERVHPFPGSRNRHLHVYTKHAPSPPGFPRRPGMARKRPLGSGPNLSSPNNPEGAGSLGSNQL